jgi:hypothetical protein
VARARTPCRTAVGASGSRKDDMPERRYDRATPRRVRKTVPTCLSGFRISTCVAVARRSSCRAACDYTPIRNPRPVPAGGGAGGGAPRRNRGLRAEDRGGRRREAHTTVAEAGNSREETITPPFQRCSDASALN